MTIESKSVRAGRSALIIGGDGQIGRAVARNLLAYGWDVSLTRRSGGPAPPDLVGRVETLQLDRDVPGALAIALAGGADAVIDTVAYDARHAQQWGEVQTNVGALVVISSAAVYRDLEGRSFDQAQGRGFPDFPIPIPEDQPTVEPGSDRYATRKVALEQALLDKMLRPTTILRPAAIHGEGSRKPREWWFLKRILDGRRCIPLAYGGQSRFHTSAAANIAELCRVALERPETRVLNAADPEALTVTQIGEAIASLYGAEIELVTFPGAPERGVGEHPWCVPKPVVLDMRCAEAVGYRPVTGYRESLAEVCRSAERMARDGSHLFSDELGIEVFDYAAEDDLFERSRRR